MTTKERTVMAHDLGTPQNGIFVNGISLESYLDKLKDDERRREILQGDKQIHLYRKERIQIEGARGRCSPTKIYSRAEINNKFYERILKSMMDTDATKPELVLSLLLSDKFHTSLEILKELQEKNVEIHRQDITGILSRIGKSQFGKLLNINIAKKPFTYHVIKSALQLPVEKAYQLYSARHPYNIYDVCREYPDVKEELSGNTPVTLGVEDEAQEERTRGEDTKVFTTLEKAKEQVVRVKVDFGPIRILFGIDGGNR
jgi:hypothetical protein